MSNGTISSEVKREISLIRKRAKNGRIVFVSGYFNIIHPGHLRLLKFAADCGDCLVIGLRDDDKTRVLVPPELRLESLQSIAMIDHLFILKDPIDEVIRELRPDVVVKGKEHEKKYNPELDVVNEYGGKLLFGSGEFVFSSEVLMHSEFLSQKRNFFNQPQEYIERHKLGHERLRNIIKEFSKKKVVVVGDSIVDTYISCEPLGMSREDPVVVVTPVEEMQFVGGAGIVAAHAKGLGASVKFISVVGEDKSADFLRENLSDLGVETFLFLDASRPTTTKIRFRAKNKTLFRVSELRQHAISSTICDELFNQCRQSLEGADLLIFSDFNYGCLPQDLVSRISYLCIEHDIPIVADSQSSSQMGDISRYKNLKLLTPTEYEVRVALKDFESGIVILAEKLLEKTESKNILLKLGSEGVLLHSKETPNFYTDQLPAMNINPADVAGAGDSMLTASSLALVSGADIWESAYLGSVAAACQVSKVGNTPLETEELLRAIF